MNAASTDAATVLPIGRGGELATLAVVAGGLVALGLIGLVVGTGAASTVGIAALVAAAGTAAYGALRARRAPDAIVVDGDRIGRLDGRTGATSGWTDLATIVEVAHVDGRGRLDGDSYELLVIWAERAPDPAQPSDPLGPQAQRVAMFVARGVQPLVVPVHRMDPDHQHHVVAFLARSGHTLTLRSGR